MFILTVCLTCVHSRLAIAQKPAGVATGEIKAQQPEIVSVEAELKFSDTSNTRTCRIELGQLQQGNNVLARITLINNSNKPVELGKNSSHCDCIELVTTATSVAANSKEQLLLHLKVPNACRTPRVNLPVIIRTANGLGNSIELDVNYDVAGLLAVPDDYQLLEIDKGLNSIAIPLIFSNPIQLKHLEIQPPSSLRGCFKIIFPACLA
ncbi:DUF1573 domain-containing protein [Mariniblastus fucicola]|uniref:DUF1573 domain-containing protein n=1 Tax=Mariniblastus fucicola TaxID=980251 RepID=UPI0012FC796D|nr:DUF1573 domain-containing protein [Mariniblastus fucicola]